MQLARAHLFFKEDVEGYLKTQYCPLSTASCDLLADNSVISKILRLLFAARKELENNRRLALAKTKTTTEAR